MSMNLLPAGTAAFIKQQTNNFTPKVGIVLGSGLGDFSKHIDDAVTLPYESIPGFHNCTTEGHAGQLVLGYVSGVPVACLRGRAHFYEGTSNVVVQNLIRTLKVMGCNTLLATNASGSLNLDAGPGSLMMITDHINFQGCNPLVGLNDEEYGPRFVPMEHAYDPQLCKKLRETANSLNITLHEGTYIGVLGPSFETPAEVRMFKSWGANAVGMSTVAEVIVARHCGLKVLVIAAITNYAVGLSDMEVTHDQTLRGAEQASSDMAKLVLGFLQDNKNEFK